MCVERGWYEDCIFIVMYIAIVNQTDSVLEMLLYHIQLSNHNVLLILLCKFCSKPLNAFISGLKKKLYMSFCMLKKSVLSLIFELLCLRLVEVKYLNWFWFYIL